MGFVFKNVCSKLKLSLITVRIFHKTNHPIYVSELFVYFSFFFSIPWAAVNYELSQQEGLQFPTMVRAQVVMDLEVPRRRSWSTCKPSQRKNQWKQWMIHWSWGCFTSGLFISTLKRRIGINWWNNSSPMFSPICHRKTKKYVLATACKPLSITHTRFIW